MSRIIWKDLDKYIERKRSQKKRKFTDRASHLKRKMHKKALDFRDVVNLRRIGLGKKDFELLNHNIKDTYVIHKEKGRLSKLHKRLRTHMKDRKEDKLQRQTANKIHKIREQLEQKESKKEHKEEETDQNTIESR
jgi:hypothetical protein